MLRRQHVDERPDPISPVSDRELGLAVLLLFAVITLTTIIVPLIS